MRRSLIGLAAIIMAALTLSACTGSTGPEGPQGQPGKNITTTIYASPVPTTPSPTMSATRPAPKPVLRTNLSTRSSIQLIPGDFAGPGQGYNCDSSLATGAATTKQGVKPSTVVLKTIKFVGQEIQASFPLLDQTDRACSFNASSAKVSSKANYSNLEYSFTSMLYGSKKGGIYADTYCAELAPCNENSYNEELYSINVTIPRSKDLRTLFNRTTNSYGFNSHFAGQPSIEGNCYGQRVPCTVQAVLFGGRFYYIFASGRFADQFMRSIRFIA